MRFLLALVLLLIAGAAQAGTFNSTYTVPDLSNNESGFHWYRKLGTTGTYTLIGTTGPNVATFSDTGLLENQTYCYQAGAFNSIDEKKNTETCVGTGGGVSAAPGTGTVILIFVP